MFRQRGSKSDSDGHTAQRSPEKATADSGLEGEPVLRRRKHGHKAGADDSATGARGIKSSNNGKAAIPTAAINNSPPTGCCEPTREQKQGPHSLSDDRDSPKIGQLKSAESYFYGSILQREMGSLPLHKKKRMWFVVGIVFGIVAAFLGMQYSARYSTHLATIRDYVTMATADLDLGSLLPANVGMDELLSDISRVLGKSDNEEQLKGDFEPARSLRQSDPRIGVKHPVVLVPGIVSTGLESWSTMNCSLPYFRERMWGTMTMFKAILLDKQCWIKNVMLDLDTGMDPPEVKLRAAQGLDAADYFIPKYWIWAKLIENLAEIGYDSNNMYFASFDWRLSYANMEKRDGMLSRLKLQVEHLTKMTGEKAVIVCHSMGANVFEYFMHWVESPAGANAGEDWVSKHIEAVVNIAGPMLGVSKTLSSLISGEQRETVQPLADYMLEHFLNKHERARIFRSWGGLPSLLPKGGNAVWGDLDYAPDDVVGPRRDGADSYGAMIRFADGKALGFERNLTAEDALDMLVHTLDPRIRERMLNEYSFGAFTTEADMQQHRLDHRMWTNSLQSQLPRAPDMKIYCIYGVGIETERSYYYERLTGSQIRRSERQQEESIGREREKLLKVRSGLSTSDSHTRRLLIKGAMADEVDRHKDHGPVSTLRIDTCQSNPEEFTSSGIVTTDGDGTVPLLSLGYMCVKGWKNRIYNPSNIKTVCRELKHNPAAFYTDLRGGTGASDHVTILGNYGLMEDVVRIVSGLGHELEDRIVSNITEIANSVRL